MRAFLFFLLLFHTLLLAQIPFEKVVPSHPTLSPPWFTGPLISPSPLNIPGGHINIEPYVFAIANVGRYDNEGRRVKIPTAWNNFIQPSIQIGVKDWLEIDVSPVLFYNYNHGKDSWVLGDTPFVFAFQLYQTKKALDRFNHYLRLEILGLIPFGPYQKLNPKLRGTDVGGTGSWRPGVALNWGSLFYLGKRHFASWRVTALYEAPNSVSVQGLNAYGGDPSTSGRVYPSRRFTVGSAIEVNITQQLAFAMEAIGRWGGKRRFHGTTLLNMTNKRNMQISLAPAIEYNFSATRGLIFGSWFTIQGRNSPQFISSVLAVNFFF